MTTLPFEHLNLRRNPFGELSRDEQSQLAIVDLSSALKHLQPRSETAKQIVVQFVGEKGFGKTTHLLALGSKFPESTYLYIPEDERRDVPSRGEPLFVDEAQRLTLWQRIRLFRSGRTLVLGTHCDFTQQLHRAGCDVLTFAADRHTGPDRIETILNARIEAARRNNGPTPRVTSLTAERLYHKHGPDIRSIQHSLYDVFQNLRSIEDV